MKVVVAHRVLSGVALLSLYVYYTGYLPWKLVLRVAGAGLVFYLVELVALFMAAVINYRELDIVYPTVMLFATIVSLKALVDGSAIPALITSAIMFVFGYIPSGAEEKEVGG